MSRLLHPSFIEIENLNFTYPNNILPTLSDLNLTIDSHEFICVVGPSGCGKSTLLNLLAGYQEATEGKVAFKGELIKAPSWHRGVVFQNQALFPWLNVYENIAFGLKMRKLAAEDITVKVQEMLDIIGLTDSKDKYIFELSGGMQQRVQLARVLVNNPELVLLDEPLGALDAITRRKMQDFLRNLWQQSSSTFFMITHDIDEALMLATRILVMNKDSEESYTEVDVDYTDKILAGQSSEDYIDKKYMSIRNHIYHSFDD